MMKPQRDLIAAEKVITWTVASNCLMMQWARGKRNQWTVKMCAMYAIYTYPAAIKPHIIQNKKDEDGSSKSITSFDITFEISETSGSSGSMILFNKPYGSSKNKMSELWADVVRVRCHKIYGYPSQQDHKPWCCQVDRMICYQKIFAFFGLVHNIIKCS